MDYIMDKKIEGRTDGRMIFCNVLRGDLNYRIYRHQGIKSNKK